MTYPAETSSVLTKVNTAKEMLTFDKKKMNKVCC